jgi:hypothetical protein
MTAKTKETTTTAVAGILRFAQDDDLSTKETALSTWLYVDTAWKFLEQHIR